MRRGCVPIASRAQCLDEVGNEVFRFLQTDGDADEPIGDIHARAGFGAGFPVDGRATGIISVRVSPMPVARPAIRRRFIAGNMSSRLATSNESSQELDLNRRRAI